jgi:hypothetical protein
MKKALKYGAFALIALALIGAIAGGNDVNKVFASSGRAPRVVGSARASGDFATAIASATVNRPTRLSLRIIAKPRQRVDGNWTLVCSKGMGAGSKSGTVAGRSTLTRPMRFPMARPDSCTAAGSGSLSGSGRLTVQILVT